MLCLARTHHLAGLAEWVPEFGGIVTPRSRPTKLGGAPPAPVIRSAYCRRSSSTTVQPGVAHAESHADRGSRLAARRARPDLRARWRQHPEMLNTRYLRLLQVAADGPCVSLG